MEVEVDLICVHQQFEISIPQGFLTVPIWWYQPQGPLHHWKDHQDQTNCTLSQGSVWKASSTPGENTTELQQPVCHK